MDEAASCHRPYTSGEARTRRQNIGDEDFIILGFGPDNTTPEHAMTSVTCVVPPVIKPSIHISRESESRGHEYLA